MSEKMRYIDRIKRDKNAILLGLLAAFGFSFLLFAFAPLDTYFGNARELWFSQNDLIGPLLLAFFGAFLLIFAVLFFTPGRARKILISLVFSGMAAFYVQGNFMVGGYGILTGSDIDWESMTGWGIVNLLIWIGIFILPLVVLFLKEKIFENLVKFGTIIVSGITVVTMTFSFIDAQSRIVNDSYLSTDEMFSVSQEENIITFVADTFEGTYLRRILEDSPEFKEDLKDFTFYENTSGVSNYTYLSMSDILTGNLFPIDKAYSAGMRQCFQNSDFFDFMHEQGYEVNYYTENGFCHSSDIGKVDNLKFRDMQIDADTRFKITKKLFRFTLFKYAPHFLKPDFVVYTEDFSALQKNMSFPAYVFDDLVFYQDLLGRGFTADRDKKQYILYHLNGVHAPFNMDRNFNQVSYEGKDVSNYEKALEKAYVPLKIFIGMLEQLKASGVYDQSTIIFTADHGDSTRFNTALMIKPAHYTGEFKTSQAPISLEADYIPFIKQTAEGKGMDADLFQIREDDDRVRYVYSYYSNDGYAQESNIRTKIAVRGHAMEESSYQIEEDEYNYPQIDIEPVKLGETVSFGNLKKIDAKGFTYETGETRSRNASIGVKLDSVPETLGLTLSVGSVAGESQELIARIDGTEIFRQTMQAGDQSVEIEIPKEYISKEMKIDFEFPDCVRQEKVSETETLQFGLSVAFVFSDVTFH
ncbi:MAG: sulfatase-like hydrolase/transferase [Oscillospiraceae bacterium]|nr:sulfatase-like hydrolase/transferase [Oscillospiraceae bacterium]